MNIKNKDNIVLGGLIHMGGYVFLALMSALSKYLQETAGFSTIEITFFCYLCVVIFSMPWILKQGITDALRSENYPVILLRTILGLGTFYIYFMVVRRIPIVTAVTLVNTAPFWVVILAVIFLKERVSKGTILSIFAGFIGVVMVIRPRLGAMDLTGYSLALFAGMLTAGVVILRRVLKIESWKKVIAIYSVIAAVISGVFMIPLFRMPVGVEWGLLAAVGVCMYCMQAFVMIAARYAKASLLGPLSYISIVVSGILGWLLWGYIPSLVGIIGIFTIIVSGIIILLVGLREQKSG